MLAKVEKIAKIVVLLLGISILILLGMLSFFNNNTDVKTEPPVDLLKNEPYTYLSFNEEETGHTLKQVITRYERFNKPVWRYEKVRLYSNFSYQVYFVPISPEATKTKPGSEQIYFLAAEIQKDSKTIFSSVVWTDPAYLPLQGYEELGYTVLRFQYFLVSHDIPKYPRNIYDDAIKGWQNWCQSVSDENKNQIRCGNPTE